MFALSIVTPEKIIFEGEVRSLVAPGSDGYLGVLSNHAPLISALKPGRLEFRDADDNTTVMAVSGGFVEISNNQATLLIDAAELVSEIDTERAGESLKRARHDLDQAQQSGDRGAAEAARAAIDRATNRLSSSSDSD